MNDDQVLLLDAPAERPCTHRRAHHHHGTLARYVLDRCRCRSCREAHGRYAQNRRSEQAHGTWQRFADAGPVREHLEQLLRVPLWRTTIAERSGVSVTTINKILSLRDPPKRVRVSTAEALLAVTAGRTTSRTAGKLFDLKED